MVEVKPSLPRRSRKRAGSHQSPPKQTRQSSGIFNYEQRERKKTQESKGQAGDLSTLWISVPATMTKTGDITATDDSQAVPTQPEQ